MQSQPENQSAPKRRRSILITFALAGIGLLLINEAADSIHLHSINLWVSLQIILGLGCLGLAVWQGARHT